MNVALYGRRASAWALHERSVLDSARERNGVAIGESRMAWEGDRLVIALDERTTPFGRRVRGRIVVHPESLTGAEIAIDGRGEHWWWPVAPIARIDVALDEPALRFTGHGYHDANAGAAPMERAFTSWVWSRARADDRAILAYDVACATGADRSLAFHVDARGVIEPIERARRAPLRPTLWRLSRFARSDDGAEARVVRSLEDGPFYARALVEHRLGGASVLAVHETLAAHRLARAWVRFCVGYRMRSDGSVARNRS
jgi:carotenoid 1,2-hydratase